MLYICKHSGLVPSTARERITLYVLCFERCRCKDCGTYLSAAESNVLNYITVNDLNDLENLDDWKALLNPLREKRLHCTFGTICNENLLSE